MASKPLVGSVLKRSLKAYQIYGANTNVGKTIMSTILCKAFDYFNPKEQTWYLKPVSTGPLEEADDRHIGQFSPNTKTKCLFQFGEAVSPHIAARSSTPLLDFEIQSKVHEYLNSCSQVAPGTFLLETAGGVHSPTPSGSSQADLYRPFRLPICLVADHHLGGISATISAFESLHIRGYDVDAILQFEDDKYQNYEYLRKYFQEKGIPSLALNAPPPRDEDINVDIEQLSSYYNKTVTSNGAVEELIYDLTQKHHHRISELEAMSTKAHQQIWYPFTQHQDISPKSIIAIDSASGDFFQTHTKSLSTTPPQPEEDILHPTFDGSASWWTQGLGHGNPKLSLAAAYAAGRYGHVMFAGTIQEPAILLASNLLKNLANPRLSRVFFSDNGSTGIEVATKMALTAAYDRYQWDIPKSEVGVLGLKGSYHGDTIGAMDCSEPSTYNGKVHWYKGRGYWFDFPQAKCVEGIWVVEPPKGMEDEFGETVKFASLAEVFDIERRSQSGGEKYREYITKTLERLVKEEGHKFGALIMEPVILGAGGMLFADPLFQHILVQTVRASTNLFLPTREPSPPLTPSGNAQTWTGLPVLFDEVFTGLYRLGRFTSSSFLQVHPDISVHAKLLTGGLIPLCCTVASESIYDAFLSTEKSDALLHGHSYTAHPIGCHVANTSLNAMMSMDERGEWEEYKEDWRVGRLDGGLGVEEEGQVWSVWGKEFIKDVSCRQEVESVVALGTVLAINLRDVNAGYTSTAATGLQKKLLEGSNEFKIHVRVLGNVLYMMAGQISKKTTLQSIERLLLEELA